MSKFINYFLFLSIFSTLLVASNLKVDINRVLDEFNIPNTAANRDLIATLQDEITSSDIDSFIDIVGSKYYHVSMIKSELDAINAPEFLLFLAMTESRLLNSATSAKKAGGMWQFMPRTARVFGLRIDEYVDERRDPFASTDAAFRYLNSLQSMFDKWYISIMAYNCGQGCMRKAIRTANSNDLSALFEPGTLPKETRFFLRKIIKHFMIAQNSQIRELLDSSKKQLKLSKIAVKSGTKLSDVSKSIDISISDMKYYNPHIKKNISPKNSTQYYFYIPSSKVETYIASLSQDEKREVIRVTEYRTHTVKQGETITEIAKSWDISMIDLVRENELTSSQLTPDQKIQIPIKKVELDTKKYEVQKGDTLIGISNKFNVNLNLLLATNNIKSSKIIVGDVIVIP